MGTLNFKSKIITMNEALEERKLYEVVEKNNLLGYWETIIRQGYNSTSYLPVKSVVSSILADYLSISLQTLGLPSYDILIVQDDIRNPGDALIESEKLGEEIDRKALSSTPFNEVEAMIKGGLAEFLRSYDFEKGCYYIPSKDLYSYMQGNSIDFLTTPLNLGSIFLMTVKSNSTDNYLNLLQNEETRDELIEFFTPLAKRITKILSSLSIDGLSTWERHAYREPFGWKLITPHEAPKKTWRLHPW